MRSRCRFDINRRLALAPQQCSGAGGRCTPAMRRWGGTAVGRAAGEDDAARAAAALQLVEGHRGVERVQAEGALRDHATDGLPHHQPEVIRRERRPPRAAAAGGDAAADAARLQCPASHREHTFHGGLGRGARSPASAAAQARLHR